MRDNRKVIVAALALALATWTASPAAAETGELRVAIQPGLTYLPFTLMEHGALIEKHARAAGLGDIKVSWFKVAGGDVMNDGILSGSVDIAATGTPPFLVLWSKTRGS